MGTEDRLAGKVATADKGSMNGTRNGLLTATGDHGTPKLAEFIIEYSR
jgi:hypothetical protein